MKPAWLTTIARLIGFRCRARSLPFRPAWFDAAYLSSPERPAMLQPPRTRAYDERERAAVWHKGRPIIGWDPEDWRVDHAGNPIFRHHYGDADSSFGWEIAPIAANGGDSLANLRPQLCRPAASAWARHERAPDFNRFAQ